MTLRSTIRTARNFVLGLIAVAVLLAVIVIVGVIAIIAQSHANKTPLSTVLQDGTEVTMTLRPFIVGIHSDYHRNLSVKNATGSVSEKLFEDTGWWRGSQLYRTEDDAIILHEGQSGCLMLVTPEGQAVVEDYTCKNGPNPDIDIRCTAPTEKPRPSFQFPSWTYLGRFYEVGYAPASTAGECWNKDRL